MSACALLVRLHITVELLPFVLFINRTRNVHFIIISILCVKKRRRNPPPKTLRHQIEKIRESWLEYNCSVGCFFNIMYRFMTVYTTSLQVTAVSVTITDSWKLTHHCNSSDSYDYRLNHASLHLHKFIAANPSVNIIGSGFFVVVHLTLHIICKWVPMCSPSNLLSCHRSDINNNIKIENRDDCLRSRKQIKAHKRLQMKLNAF